MKATVISSCYGGYDTLKPTCELTRLPGDEPIHWVFVTDSEPLHLGDQDPLGWEIIYEPRPELHPNRAAKHAKLFPRIYTPDNTQVSIWLDASFRVVHPGLMVDLAPLAAPIAQFNHPWRQCAYDEATASVGIPKYAGEPITDQTADLLTQRMPPNWGLWATGVIVRWHGGRFDATENMCRTWMRLIRQYSFQDQISQPLALWQHNLRPTHIPGTHLANPWLAYEGSVNH